MSTTGCTRPAPSSGTRPIPAACRGGNRALTDYVSTLPARLVTRYRETLDVFELPFEARGFAMFAAWHPRSHLDPASVWLRNLLAQVAQQ
ncbi:MAG: hypothetical protein KGQ57_17015 [Burkholderiales bacterium]|nr:hypothetical protein [Burkholderiales bacterium]